MVGVWIASVAVLAFAGRDLDRELSIHPIYVNGTASKQAHELAQRDLATNTPSS